MKLRIFAVALAAALAGCGGSAGVQPATSPVTQTAGSGSTANAEIDSTITVPATAALQSNQRSAQYVSASTLGLKIVVTDIPGANQVASYTPITTTYTLTTGVNKIVVPTPTSATGHSSDLTYVAYNAAPVAGAIPTGAKAVGWGLATGFVVAPGQNSNSIELSAVADAFPAPLVDTGSFGMMSAVPPALAGAKATLGFGGNAVPNGIATLLDGGGDNITTAAGGPWPVVGAIPAVTTAATGVPLTIVETAGTCGSVGTAPHLKLSLDGGAAATTAAIGSTTDTVAADYDGNGGAGWYAVISAKAQTSALTYTLSSLAATSTSTDFSCPNQTLSFSEPTETALINVVQHIAAVPYTVTVPNTTNCNQLVNVYVGNTTNIAAKIPPGVPTSLGTSGAAFTMQLIPTPPSATSCPIEIQDANATATGGANYPGATTYVSALLTGAELQIIVP